MPSMPHPSHQHIPMPISQHFHILLLIYLVGRKRDMIVLNREMADIPFIFLYTDLKNISYFGIIFEQRLELDKSNLLSDL